MSDGTRLRPGVALFDVPGRGAALRAADGTLLDIGLAPERIAALREWFDRPPSGQPGSTPADPPGAPAPGDAPAELAAFAEAGHLGAPRSWPPERARVVVLHGAGPVGAAVVAALRLAGAAPLPHPAGPSPDLLAEILAMAPWAVCAVHAGPAPRWWADLDVLPGHGVAWQRVAVEGRHALFEPVAAGPHDVGHRDVRARRLAAAGSGHRHLAAYWSATAPLDLDPADLALIAALAAADLRTWAVADPDVTDPDAADPDGVAGDTTDTAGAGSLVPAPLPARLRLRVVDLDTASIAEHPVLPVPPCAP
ncbi:hypothetical protein [Pseudonocardia sp. MH-G8]|uniref:hypothetical protein n=1 Tax=Pseudonocardia sp. MH-G8 TaxID=1854588 RepID=UPI001E3A21B5|nr:hypothetical protein [Pseudonocardia sp. MH-G8]